MDNYIDRLKEATDPVVVFNSRIESKSKELNNHLLDMALNILNGEITAYNCDKVLLKGISLKRDLQQDLATWRKLVEG